MLFAGGSQHAGHRACTRADRGAWAAGELQDLVEYPHAQTALPPDTDQRLHRCRCRRDNNNVNVNVNVNNNNNNASTNNDECSCNPCIITRNVSNTQVVQAYMRHIQANAEGAVRDMLRGFSTAHGLPEVSACCR